MHFCYNSSKMETKSMKIAYLGCGSWGYCLATLLASKGFEVVSWTNDSAMAEQLSRGEEHPSLRSAALPGKKPATWSITTDMAKALHGADMIVEAVTSAGLRPVLNELKHQITSLSIPFVITSKGIEQGTGHILPDVVLSVFGESARPYVGVLSGPGFADEVTLGLPASVVAAAWQEDLMQQICQVFTTAFFRVYPNSDIVGVSYGGALKNIFAIACGIADGLKLGSGAKAALMTRGLHEMRKLAVTCGARGETLNGLSGMGDLCLTCSSSLSRNNRFGMLIAQGYGRKEAEDAIGMVVEGAYTCVAAKELSERVGVTMPITEIIFKILYEGLSPKDAVSLLMQRAIKEEHL
jgi:glycerol-3-phosphate dehydrogenase (NAD(P)+)